MNQRMAAGWTIFPTRFQRRSWQVGSHLVLLAAVFGVAGDARSGMAAEPKPTILAVVAVDSLQAIRTQANWVGGLVGNPAVGGMIDAFAPMVLGADGPGLQAIDETRPVGVLMAVVSEQPVLHGFVPVADGAGVELAAMITKAASQFGAAVDATAGPRWVVVRPQGSPVVMADPGEELNRVVDRFSVGLKVYPSRLPEAMQTQLYEAVEANSANPLVAGAMPGQASIDADAAGDAVRQMIHQTAALMIGLNIDPNADEVAYETHFLANEGAEAATLWSEAADVTPLVAVPKPRDEQAVVLRGQLTQAVATEQWQVLEASLNAMLAEGNAGADQIEGAGEHPANPAELVAGGASPTVVAAAVASIMQSLPQTLSKAVSPTGVIDACIMVEAPAADAAIPLPTVMLGLRVADGEALAAEMVPLFEKLGLELEPPGEPVDGWRYHDLRVPIGGVTIASTAEQVFVVVGGAAGYRLTFADDAATQFKPFLDLTASLSGLLQGNMFTALEPDTAELIQEAEGLEPRLRLLLRPLPGGAATKIAVNGDFVAAATKIVLKEVFSLRPVARIPDQD